MACKLYPDRHPFSPPSSTSQVLTLYRGWDPSVMARRACWLIGLLYPTADVGRFFIWELVLELELQLWKDAILNIFISVPTALQHLLSLKSALTLPASSSVSLIRGCLQLYFCLLSLNTNQRITTGEEVFVFLVTFRSSFGTVHAPSSNQFEMYFIVTVPAKELLCHAGRTASHRSRTHAPAVSTKGWNFHWSSSQSKKRRFIILFFSSGGMKFSMIRYLSKFRTWKT